MTRFKSGDAHSRRPGRTRSRLRVLLRSDYRSNPGWSLDVMKARSLLTEIRLEQAVYRWSRSRTSPSRTAIWSLVRFLGSVYQWRLFNCEISGKVEVGRGLRIPHPQNIIIGMTTQLGDYCSVYHNVTIARSTFREGVDMPRIGDRVVLGAGAILIGGIEVGSDSVVAAGAVLTRSVPPGSMVISVRPTERPRTPVGQRNGSDRFANPHPLVNEGDPP